MGEQGALPAYVVLIPGGVELRLKVVPGSSRSGIVGPLGDRLKIKVAAPPEGGKANREVVEVIRKWTGARDVAVVGGMTSPEKTVRVAGIDAASLNWGDFKK